MKPANLISLMAVAAALVGGFAALRQRTQIARLQAQIVELARPGARSATQPPSTTTALTNTAGLTEAEKLELMRLRAEITRLRARERELAPLRAENESLRARHAAVTNQAPGQATGAGYVRLREAQFAGQATPEAALQTFMWAIARGDTNTLGQVISPHAVAGAMRELMEDGERLALMSRMIPGYRILEVETRSPDEVALKVEFLPNEPVEPMVMRRVDNSWRLEP